MGDDVRIKIDSEKNFIELFKSRVELQSYYNFLLEEIRDLEVKRRTEDVGEKIKMYDAILDIVAHMLAVSGVE